MKTRAGDIDFTGSIQQPWCVSHRIPLLQHLARGRLRPLVERVGRGDAEEREKAELERLLVAFWRARLDLGDMKVADAVMAIRADDRAGALLRHVEEWLHAPNPPDGVDVGELLAPYRSVTADQLQPEAR